MKTRKYFYDFFSLQLGPNILNRVCQMPVFSVQYSQVEQSPIESKARFSFTPLWGINVKAHHTPTKPPPMTIPTPTNLPGNFLTTTP